ncbi:hypothetical protein AXZ77_0757 [Thioclava sp. ES.031]|uniref:hypothetical protein n=1 Tax=Thioclava sp. ES.031 TaxID=1798203 RepID=UPI000C00998A|nr:hypothetical protein [Thioclava sp. ES.031]PFG62183.1 hypothetical protein AXZ77_0757 [Thioclava sp. ES.031]
MDVTTRNAVSLANIFLRRAVLGGVLALAACTSAPSFSQLGSAVQTTTQYALGRLSQLWASPEDALIMLHRQVGTEYEQKIGLANPTTLPGDNFLLLMALATNGRTTGRFELNQFIEHAGGVPAPFKKIDERNLRSTTDSLGVYFWQEYDAGRQTRCVLAFRRLEPHARVLPKGANAMDVMLRNCVHGSTQTALKPIQDAQIRLGVVADVSTRSGGNLTLSPLAAPLQ